MTIDTHVHLGPNQGDIESLIDTVSRLEIDRIIIFTTSPGESRATNAQVMEAHLKHPDVVIPFYHFQLGQEKAEAVDSAKKDGFKGLKLINPSKNYNDESYFPVWERCEELGLITTFHTGIVGRRPEQVDYDIDSSRMKVIYLDRIARKFQKMIMFVAHLGNPDYGEACMMCRWHANMYFDLSGSTLKKKKPQFFDEMLWWSKQKIRYKDEFGRGPWDKLLFGTDVSPPEMQETMNDYLNLFDTLELQEPLRNAVMGDTAARLLGIAQP